MKKIHTEVFMGELVSGLYVKIVEEGEEDKTRLVMCWEL